MDTAGGITPVHARYYDLCSNYHRVRSSYTVSTSVNCHSYFCLFQISSDHASYYRDALRYLGCMEVKDIPGTVYWPGVSVVKYSTGMHVYMTGFQKGQDNKFIVASN